MNKRFVFDTNALISAALIPKSVNGLALKHAVKTGTIVVSEPVLHEFTEVLFRKKFDKYFINDEERIEAIKQLEGNAMWYFPVITITACRDPKDNKFLELALTAKAACIVSGDEDLLTLHPFHNIPILKAAVFLQQF